MWRRLDTPGNAVIVTGSSAALLSREIATALRGRTWQVLIHPFSFEEALRHQGRPVPDGLDAALPTGRERSRLERGFLDWLEAGGFPEAQGVDSATRHQLLRDHVDVAMLRDMVERHDVRNVTGLRYLVRHLLGNAGSLFRVGKFHGALKSHGIAIGKDTLHQFLSHLEDCFLVRILWMESKSERQRMVNPRKIYPVDPGLIPIFDRTGRANAGHALETAVLVELPRIRGNGPAPPEGHEVDFLALATDGSHELIQVCADLSDAATAARESRALAAGGVLFSEARQRLLTLTRGRFPDQAPATAMVQSAYEWLLSPPASRAGGCLG